MANSDSEMQRFESTRPNQPVRLKRVKYEGRSKTAPYREVSQICAGLRVRNLAMEAPFLPPVSAGLFWCLVFAVCPIALPERECDLRETIVGYQRSRPRWPGLRSHHRGAAADPGPLIPRASLDIRAVKSSILERNVFRIGDVFAL